MNAAVVASTAPRVEPPERADRGAGRGTVPDDVEAFDRHLATVLEADDAIAEIGHDRSTASRDRSRWRSDDRDDRTAEAAAAIVASASVDRRPPDRQDDRTVAGRDDGAPVGSAASDDRPSGSVGSSPAGTTAAARTSGSSDTGFVETVRSPTAATTTATDAAASDSGLPGPVAIVDGMPSAASPVAASATVGATPSAATSDAGSPDAGGAGPTSDIADPVLPGSAPSARAASDPATGVTTGPTDATTGDPAAVDAVPPGAVPSGAGTSGSGTSASGDGRAGHEPAPSGSGSTGSATERVEATGLDVVSDGSGSIGSADTTTGDTGPAGSPTRADGAVGHRSIDAPGARNDASGGRPVAATNDPRPLVGADAAQRARLAGLGATADLEMDLGDEGLGPLRLHASATGSTINLHLSSTDPAVRELLARHASELRHDLDAAGVDLGSFDVGAQPDRQASGRAASDGDATRADGGTGRERDDPAPTRRRPATADDTDPHGRRGPGSVAGGPADRSLDLRL